MPSKARESPLPDRRAQQWPAAASAVGEAEGGSLGDGAVIPDSSEEGVLREDEEGDAVMEGPGSPTGKVLPTSSLEVAAEGVTGDGGQGLAGEPQGELKARPNGREEGSEAGDYPIPDSDESEEEAGKGNQGEAQDGASDQHSPSGGSPAELENSGPFRTGAGKGGAVGGDTEVERASSGESPLAVAGGTDGPGPQARGGGTLNGAGSGGWVQPAGSSGPGATEGGKINPTGTVEGAVVPPQGMGTQPADTPEPFSKRLVSLAYLLGCMGKHIRTKAMPRFGAHPPGFVQFERIEQKVCTQYTA